MQTDERLKLIFTQAERLLPDNFRVDWLKKAVAVNRAEDKPPTALEASGGLSLKDIAAVAATGVNYISVGAVTRKSALSTNQCASTRLLTVND